MSWFYETKGRTEGDTQSPEQALTLLSESGPGFVSSALSEGALAFRTLRVSLRKVLYLATKPCMQ